jgi:thiol-disulfide isomerase/thioredoxin
MSFELSALFATWLALALLGLAVSGLVRQVHMINKVLSSGGATGPRLGSKAPSLKGSLDLNGRPGLLLFVDSSCRSCLEILPRLGELAKEWEGQVEFAALFAGGAASTAPNSISVIENQRKTHELFGVSVTPFAVAVSDSNVVVGAAPVGSNQLLDLFVDNAAGRWRN